MQTPLLLAAVILSILRWVPVARPLYAWLPAWLQWLPPAVTAAAATISARLGFDEALLTNAIDPRTIATIDACLQALVGLLLAAQAGIHPPSSSADVAREAISRGTLTSIVFGVLLLTGCAGSFEEARLVSAQQVSATASRERCEELDDRRAWWGGIAKGSAIVAGSSGLAALPVESHEAKVGLAAGGVAAAAVGAASVYLSESAGDRWVEECR